VKKLTGVRGAETTFLTLGQFPTRTAQTRSPAGKGKGNGGDRSYCGHSREDWRPHDMGVVSGGGWGAKPIPETFRKPKMLHASKEKAMISSHQGKLKPS